MLMLKLSHTVVACALHLGILASPLPSTGRTTGSEVLGGGDVGGTARRETGLLGGGLGSGVSTLLDGVNYGLTGTKEGVQTGSGLLGGALGSGVGTLLNEVNGGLTGTKDGVQSET